MSQRLKNMFFTDKTDIDSFNDLSIAQDLLSVTEEYQHLAKKRLVVGNEGFAKDFFSKLKNWYSSIFITNEKLKNKGNDLLEKFKDLNINSKPKESEITLSLKLLLSKEESFDDLIKVLTNTLIEGKTFLLNSDVVKIVKEMSENFDNILEKEGIGKRDFRTFTSYAKETAETFKKIIDLPKTKGDNKIIKNMEAEGYKITKSGSLLGNKAIYTYYPLSNFQITEKDASFFDADFYQSFSKAGLKTGGYGEPKLNEEKILVPKVTEMIDILEKTLELCNIVDEHKKKSDDKIRIQTDIDDQFRELFGEVIEWNDENEEQFEKDENVRRIFDIIPQRLWDILDDPSKPLVQSIMKGTVSIFSIAENVLKQY